MRSARQIWFNRAAALIVVAIAFVVGGIGIHLGTDAGASQTQPDVTRKKTSADFGRNQRN